jgi:hypothetical protein
MVLVRPRAYQLLPLDVSSFLPSQYTMHPVSHRAATDVEQGCQVWYDRSGNAQQEGGLSLCMGSKRAIGQEHMIG